MAADEVMVVATAPAGDQYEEEYDDMEDESPEEEGTETDEDQSDDDYADEECTHMVTEDPVWHETGASQQPQSVSTGQQTQEAQYCRKKQSQQYST